MTAKLWVVFVVYELIVAIPYAIGIGILVEGILGFLAFLGFTGMYITMLLLVMGFIDYAKR